MASVAVYVDLEEFSTSDLLDELAFRDVITEEMAEELRTKKKAPTTNPPMVAAPDEDEMAEALWSMSRGRKIEALIHFERAIPALRGIVDLVERH